MRGPLQVVVTAVVTFHYRSLEATCHRDYQSYPYSLQHLHLRFERGQKPLHVCARRAVLLPRVNDRLLEGFHVLSFSLSILAERLIENGPGFLIDSVKSAGWCLSGTIERFKPPGFSPYFQKLVGNFVSFGKLCS